MAKAFQVDTGGTLTTNLVSYYKLGDEGDYYSTRNLTNENSVTFASAKVAYGGDLGASNTNKALVISNDMGIGAGAVSVSFWVKLQTEIGSGLYTFFEIEDATTHVGYYLLYDYNSGTRRLRWARNKRNVAANEVTYNVTMGTSDYYHIVCLYDTTNLKLFINGTQQGGDVAASGNGTTDGDDHFRIGRTYGFASAIFDELSIHSKAVSTTEISDLYNGGSGQTMVDTYNFQVDTTGSLGTGLQVYYALEDNANDLSGNGYNGTVTGASYVTGKVSKGLDFEDSGSDQYVTFGDIPDMTDITISAWVDVEATGTNRSIVCKDTSAGGRAFELFIQSAEKINFSPGGGGQESTGTVSATGFQHILITYSDSANETKFYINGSLDSTKTEVTSMATSSANLLMGIRNYSGTTDHDMDGIIDEVGIWNRVLTAQQIADLYNSGSGQTMTEPSVAISVSDTVTVAESTSLEIDFNPSVNDSVTVAENIESVTDIPGISVFDSITVSESLQVDFPFDISVFDSVTVSESLSTEIHLGDISVNDAVTITESVSVEVSLTKRGVVYLNSFQQDWPIPMDSRKQDWPIPMDDTRTL